MFAIVEVGGNQYRVSSGSVIDTEKIDSVDGGMVTLTKVLFVQNNDGTSLVGRPLLEGTVVEAEVIKNYRDEKVIDFVKRRRKNSRRKNGHRQPRTKLKVLHIGLN